MKRRYRNFHSKYLRSLKLRFISWFDKKHPGKYCWADCVSWAFDYDRWNPFRIEGSSGCEIESKTHGSGTCYCGGWEGGVCFDTLPESEKQQIRAERESEYTTELPF